ncbi:outer membrane beta-barrel protein [Shewanella aestuarii]|uniref:Porin family protein n=1 Tax=Shewanella aestuarii TaxID=1028752 RepID=A0A6G9QHY7_9GAMM|nr:outer membrane beta-barrel protein [Shewanella aestuarii]QIR13753.1 porin family protein [Shewanella aestuarii]
MGRNFLVSSLALTLCCFSTQAEVYVAPFAGYSFGGNGLGLTINEGVSSDLNISESEHYGLVLGMKTNDPGSVYILYSTQSTDLRDGGLSSDVVTELNVDYWHLGGSLYFQHGAFNPYVTASAGVTRLIPSQSYSSETNFSMAIGGGLAYGITSNVRVFADVRGYATFFNTNSSLFCDESECLWKVEGDLIWQAQANIGFEVAF